MQHSVYTVDPNLLDLRQFPRSSTSDNATVGDEHVKYQWVDKSVNEDTNLSFHDASTQDHQSSDGQHEDWPEVLGSFEPNSTYGQDKFLQSWNDRIPASDVGAGEDPFDSLQRFGHVGPWNHLQSFSSQATHENQRYRTSSDLSSGVPSSTETAGWPGTSPPDSSSAFVLYDNIIDAGKTQQAEPFILRKQGSANYFSCDEEHNNADATSNHSIPQVVSDEENMDAYSPEGEHQVFPDIGSETSELHIESPSLYHYYDVLSSQQDGSLAKYPIEARQNYHKITSLNHYNDPVTYYSDSLGSCYYDDPLIEYAGATHPQSAIIGIETTAERFQPDATSVPPFSAYRAEDLIEESRSKSKIASRCLALRPASRNSRGNRKSSITKAQPSLAVIHEDGKGGLASPSPTTKKGRRAGPLSKLKAAQAAKMRKDKSVCIRCKMMKQSCSGEDPCIGCRENVGAKIWKSPCVKAEFLDLVEAGTCNYISQRSINHLTLDHSRRVKLHLSATFDLTELLDLLKPRLSRFNIHARQLSGSLYTLDLAKCHDFLMEIRNVQESGNFELRDFIDNKLLKASDWLKCVTEPCSITESLSLLAKWNNMPSRASYEIVSLRGDVSSRPMDVENPEDEAEIRIAAQLSRIICRALEVAAFKYLQKELNNLTKGSKSSECAERFVRELGQLLVTLRWRISWWELLGDGSAIRDDSRDRYIERVNNITRVLYFYYCNAKKKLPSWTEQQSLTGVQSFYADAEPIFDDFPHADSIDGFHEWMTHGRELISEARVQQTLSRY